MTETWIGPNQEECFKRVAERINELDSKLSENGPDYDGFIKHFSEYFRGCELEKESTKYLYSLRRLDKQILSLRFLIEENAMSLSQAVLELIYLDIKNKTKYAANIEDIQETDPKNVAVFKDYAVASRTNLKALLKSFYIFNKIFFDNLAQIIYLAYLKNGTKIDSNKYPSYNDIFKVTSPGKVTNIKKIDPGFCKKITELNSRYLSVKNIRDDFVHDFCDLRLQIKYEGTNVYLSCQILTIDDLLDKEHASAPWQSIESIDELFELRRQIQNVMKEHFTLTAVGRS